MRLSIRDLLWLTVVVALAAGWWVHHRRLSRTAAESRHAQAVAERHLGEYQLAYIDLYGAVDREGFSTARINGKTYIVDLRKAAKSVSAGEVDPTAQGGDQPRRRGPNAE